MDAQEVLNEIILTFLLGITTTSDSHHSPSMNMVAHPVT